MIKRFSSKSTTIKTLTKKMLLQPGVIKVHTEILWNKPQAKFKQIFEKSKNIFGEAKDYISFRNGLVEESSSENFTLSIVLYKKCTKMVLDYKEFILPNKDKDLLIWKRDMFLTKISKCLDHLSNQSHLFTKNKKASVRITIQNDCENEVSNEFGLLLQKGVSRNENSFKELVDSKSFKLQIENLLEDIFSSQKKGGLIWDGLKKVFKT